MSTNLSLVLFRTLAISLPIVFAYCACTPRLLSPQPDSAEVELEQKRQYREASRTILEHWQRLAAVAGGVSTASGELCGQKQRSYLGIVAISRSDLPRIFGRQGFWDEFNVAFAEEFEIGKDVRILHVVPESPASRGGLRPGDILLSLRGRSISSRDQLENAQRRKIPGAVEVLVKRDGVEDLLFLDDVRECWYGTSILVADYINAFADGRTIRVTTGMLRFCRNDDELAVVLGHELAHNVLGHSVRSYKRFEKEADYLGCYFAARAGYDISRGVEFWRRLARESPAAISERASYAHSGTAARASALQEAVEEISEKIRSGKPLIPNLTE